MGLSASVVHAAGPVDEGDLPVAYTMAGKRVRYDLHASDHFLDGSISLACDSLPAPGVVKASMLAECASRWFLVGQGYR
jgi:hypothetical protein